MSTAPTTAAESLGLPGPGTITPFGSALQASKTLLSAAGLGPSSPIGLARK